MVGFFSKKVGAQESLAEKLVAARQQRELSLAEAASQLNINQEYLQALEQGQYGQLPGNIYAKNFLKVYLELLDLEQAEMLALYEEEIKLHQRINQADEGAPRMIERVTQRRLVITPKIIRRGLVTLVVLACLVYLGLQLKRIVTPPWLEVSQPANNLIIAEYFIEISGSTEKETTLVINGQEVMTDREGHFNKRLDLQDGINMITISAQKKYSQPQVVYRQVLVQNEATSSFNNQPNSI